MNIWRQLAYYLSLVTYLGIVIVCCVFVGYFLGSYLDNIMATELIFTVIGVLLGSFSGLYMMYRMATKYIDRQ